MDLKPKNFSSISSSKFVTLKDPKYLGKKIYDPAECYYLFWKDSDGAGYVTKHTIQ